MKSKEGYLLEPVDIFALGAVLFTLKAGRRPFGSARSTDLFYRYINSGKPAEFWAQHEKMSDKITYSDDFKQLIQGMIEADPKTRFTIDDIKFSKWYTGEVADKSTVIAEFNKYEKERRLFSAIEDQKRKIQRQIAKLEDEDFIIIKNVFTEYRGEGEKCQKEIVIIRNIEKTQILLNRKLLLMDSSVRLASFKKLQVTLEKSKRAIDVNTLARPSPCARILNSCIKASYLSQTA